MKIISAWRAWRMLTPGALDALVWYIQESCAGDFCRLDVPANARTHNATARADGQLAVLARARSIICKARPGHIGNRKCVCVPLLSRLSLACVAFQWWAASVRIRSLAALHYCFISQPVHQTRCQCALASCLTPGPDRARRALVVFKH